ncbi:MAG: tRNA (N6-threonylcarbamoyladenosine(37)-N6)-methyltransferase TrmO [Candidatus Sedimenticola sp. 20ELBAFRAG]
MKYEFDAIGHISSPFKEKFGIPRQSGLVPEARASLVFDSPYNRAEAIAGLEGYSHLWIQFVFHQAMRGEWQPMVRPPRLGGNEKVGVFASRSPFRPNPIGLSVARLEGVSTSAGQVELLLSGLDLVDGTPVLDVKPYVVYSDSIPDASSGFAPSAPEKRLEVVFSQRALEQIQARADSEQLQALIAALLEIDPRPAYRSGESGDRIYGIRLYDFDLRWRVTGEQVEVLELA